MSRAELEQAADALRQLSGELRPKVAIVLGSGMAGITDLLENSRRLPFGAIPGMPDAKVQGHSGEVVAGTLDSIPVLCQSGRVHLYEGGESSASVLLVRSFARIGVKTLVLTNAAGGLRRTFHPGDLMLIGDHINLSFRSVLAGPVVAGEERFPDMSDPYDPELKLLARDSAKSLGIGLAGRCLRRRAGAELRNPGRNPDAGTSRRRRGRDVDGSRGRCRARGAACAASASR